MNNWVKTYCRGKNENVFFSPASREEISRTEKALGIAFPGDYKEFLLSTNGFEGWIGEFYIQLEPVGKIVAETQIWCGDFFPWAVFLGSNQNLEMLVLATREKELQFGLLPNIGDDHDFISLGNSFLETIKRLYAGTAFRR